MAKTQPLKPSAKTSPKPTKPTAKPTQANSIKASAAPAARSLDEATLRAWWWAKQGLGGSLAGRTSAEVLAMTGWSRSVGGCGPYLALFARAGLSRAQVDADVAALAIHELPSARGCTYVVPACDYALALRAGQGRGEAAEIATAKKYLGVTDAEIDTLCAAIVGALGKGPLDPRVLKESIGGAVRHLGDMGKKRGVTTTLSLGLGKLQAMGEIRRVPANGRLDQQRYAYALWRPSPARPMSDDEAAIELARRFFRWIGPAAPAHFSAWAGLTVKATQSALAELGLVPLVDGDSRVIFPDDLAALRDFNPEPKPRFALVGSIDNIAHLPRDVAGLLGAEDADLQVKGEKRAEAAASLSDLPNHAIFDRGRLIGLWDFDVASNSIVSWTFKVAPPGLADVIARTEAFVRGDLGDARAFSLDSPESRGGRLAELRARSRA